LTNWLAARLSTFFNFRERGAQYHNCKCNDAKCFKGLPASTFFQEVELPEMQNNPNVVLHRSNAKYNFWGDAGLMSMDPVSLAPTAPPIQDEYAPKHKDEDFVINWALSTVPSVIKCGIKSQYHLELISYIHERIEALSQPHKIIVASERKEFQAYLKVAREHASKNMGNLSLDKFPCYSEMKNFRSFSVDEPFLDKSCKKSKLALNLLASNGSVSGHLKMLKRHGAPPGAYPWYLLLAARMIVKNKRSFSSFSYNSDALPIPIRKIMSETRKRYVEELGNGANFI